MSLIQLQRQHEFKTPLKKPPLRVFITGTGPSIQAQIRDAMPDNVHGNEQAYFKVTKSWFPAHNYNWESGNPAKIQLIIGGYYSTKLEDYRTALSGNPAATVKATQGNKPDVPVYNIFEFDIGNKFSTRPKQFLNGPSLVEHLNNSLLKNATLAAQACAGYASQSVPDLPVSQANMELARYVDLVNFAMSYKFIWDQNSGHIMLEQINKGAQLAYLARFMPAPVNNQGWYPVGFFVQASLINTDSLTATQKRMVQQLTGLIIGTTSSMLCQMDFINSAYDRNNTAVAELGFIKNRISPTAVPFSLFPINVFTTQLVYVRCNWQAQLQNKAGQQGNIIGIFPLSARLFETPQFNLQNSADLGLVERVSNMRALELNFYDDDGQPLTFDYPAVLEISIYY